MLVNLDEVVTGVLISAIGAVGRWLGTAASAARDGHGRTADDLAVARWFETYKLTVRVPPDTSGMSPLASARLVELLRGDDAQAAVQELLAVRLTDGTDMDAGRAREAFALTLASADDPEISSFAETAADYYDEEICDLVGRLKDSPMLAQIRSEALAARMIAVLRAIERHTAALAARPALRTEVDFLSRYRAHVIDQHGKLEPPDFERRRRVPIADIYVPTVIYKEPQSELTAPATLEEPPSITIWQLATRLDRSVLLGDPGGGKTTASTVLMHHFASDVSRPSPFLVTLRNFAAADPPERSVVRFIESELSTFYQCPSPPGLLDLLLLTGRAMVIFDGLDELLDTSRRADVAARVEQFCLEYPLASVLVTSRAVGYEQARLDESQFATYRLGGFRDKDVEEYTRKWFALDAGAYQNDADAFMEESQSVPDLRSNPLLLSLMCILYRGEGSLPRNRAEVYEQCTSLLLRRWDARRRIHQQLRAGHLLEPMLQHLAWWLFAREDPQSTATERELVTAATEFLHGRGFEFLDDARDAAREIIEFSRGRMWVFSEHGTTASGERLYAFTHRTFLEYFAAAQLAYSSDTPEKLARILAPHVARSEWEVISELTVQIKELSSTDGGTRIYNHLISERRRRSVRGRSNILQFLGRGLRSARPSPAIVRRLTAEIVDFASSVDPRSPDCYEPLDWLLNCSDAYLPVIDEEITSRISEMIHSPIRETHLLGLSLAVTLGPTYTEKHSPSKTARIFWSERRKQIVNEHSVYLIAAAAEHPCFISSAQGLDVISVSQALEIPNGFEALMTFQYCYIGNGAWFPVLPAYFRILARGSDWEGHINYGIRALTECGAYLITHPDPPWIIGNVHPWSGSDYWRNESEEHQPGHLAPDCYLGGAAVGLMSIEQEPLAALTALEGQAANLGSFSSLYPYIERRANGTRSTLPDLPVPELFQELFRDWANRKVSLVEFVAPRSIRRPIG
jgi:hypothetical protein